MATISDVALSRHPTFTAGQVDTVTFSTNYSRVAVTMRSPASGSTGIWFRTDGEAPVAEDDDTEWVPPVAGAELIVDLTGTDTVKLISATADEYSIRGV